MYEYALDLETLLALLSEVHQDGTLFAMLPSGLLEWKGRCAVELQLAQGKITHCQIEDSKNNTHVLDPGKAFKALNSLGVMDWQFTSKIAPTSHPRLSQSSNVPPPAFSTPPYPAPQNPLRQTNEPPPTISVHGNTAPLQSPIRNPSFAPPPTGNRRVSAPLGSTGPLRRPLGSTGPLRRVSAPLGSTDPLRRVSAPLESTGPLPPPDRFDTPFPPSFTRDSGSFHNIAVLVPKLRVEVDTQLLNSLPRKDRRVLVLIDGVRSVETINSILFPASQDINAVIEELINLLRWGIITVS